MLHNNGRYGGIYLGEVAGDARSPLHDLACRGFTLLQFGPHCCCMCGTKQGEGDGKWVDSAGPFGWDDLDVRELKRFAPVHEAWIWHYDVHSLHSTSGQQEGRERDDTRNGYLELCIWRGEGDMGLILTSISSSPRRRRHIHTWHTHAAGFSRLVCLILRSTLVDPSTIQSKGGTHIQKCIEYVGLVTCCCCLAPCLPLGHPLLGHQYRR